MAAQVAATQALVGGAEADGAVWDESRARQAAARGRVVVRAGRAAGVPRRRPGGRRPPVGRDRLSPDAVPDETPAPVRLLQERVRARFDPQGVLA